MSVWPDYQFYWFVWWLSAFGSIEFLYCPCYVHCFLLSDLLFPSSYLLWVKFSLPFLVSSRWFKMISSNINALYHKFSSIKHLTGFHKFCYFAFNSIFFLIVISSLTHGLFRGVVSNFQIFVDISCIILYWYFLQFHYSKRIYFMWFLLLKNRLKYLLWHNVIFLGESLCVLENIVSSAIVWGVIYNFHLSPPAVAVVQVSLSWLTFCLLFHKSLTQEC